MMLNFSVIKHVDREDGFTSFGILLINIDYKAAKKLMYLWFSVTESSDNNFWSLFLAYIDVLK